MVDGRWLVALPLLLFASAAHCESLAEHIRDDPACRQYNDGCSICLIKDGKAECAGLMAANSSPSRTGLSRR